MTQLKCEACGADLLPATAFCRQCGAAISIPDAAGSSEQPTMIFPHAPTAATQQLHTRGTTPTFPSKRSFSGKNLIWMIVLIALAAAVVAVVMRMSGHRESSSVTDVVVLYPGATTVVDMKNPDGSRTLQLQTRDPLSQVESWYHNNIKLEKTVRLTSNSVVLKSQKVAVTLAAEDNKTNILVKQSP